MKPFAHHSIVAAALAALLAGCASNNTAPSAQAPEKAAQTASQTASKAAEAAATKAQVSRQALAQGIYELAYSPSQNVVFVASAGGRGEGAAPSRILRVNANTLEAEGEIVLERKGFGVALDDGANRLYVGNTNDGSVTVVDTTANKVIGVVQLAEKVKTTTPEGKEVERHSHNFRELVLDKANDRLFMPGLWFEDSALYVVNTKTLEVERVIPGLGFVATGAALDASSGTFYASNMQGQLFAVNTRTLEVGKAEIAVDQPLNLAFDHRNNRLLATDQGEEAFNAMRKNAGKLDYQSRGEGNRVAVIDPASGKVIASIPTGKNPVALKLDEKNNRLFVTNREAGTVTVYDATSYALLETIELPSHPNSLALDEATGVVFVSVKNGQKDAKGSNESVARIQY